MEYKGIQSKDLDQVLHAARLRRSADLGVWLRQYVENRRLAREVREMKARHAAPTLHRPAT